MKCIDECNSDDKNSYEFNGFCYEKCPKGTIYNITNGICEMNITENSILEQNDIITISLQENIKDGSFDNVIKDVINEGNDYTISNEKTLYQITSSDKQKINKNNNFSSIDFGESEEILKGIYGIDMEIPLIIFKVDYYNPDSLIPIIGYEVYHPLNNSKLDLSYCNNNINLYIPVQIDENAIYKYDPNSDYYVDQCSSYTSDNGTDILLLDRQKEFNTQNLSLCESNFAYQGYEYSNKQSICNCKIKNELEYKSNISNNFNTLAENDLGYTNVFACTKNLFTVNGILKNMSSYILIISLLFFTATSFIFKRRGYHIIVNHMNNIIKEKMKSQSHKNNYNGDEKINFPPKKSTKKQTGFLPVNNNINSSQRKYQI